MGTHPIFESDFDCLTGKFMSDDLKTLLSNLVLDRNQPISGLLAITVIDRQGVPIFEQLHPNLSQSEKGQSPAYLSSSRLTLIGAQEATVSNNRLSQGGNKVCIAFGKKYQTIQIVKHPISIVFLATATAQTGQLLEKVSELDAYFNQLQTNAKVHLESH